MPDWSPVCSPPRVRPHITTRMPRPPLYPLAALALWPLFSACTSLPQNPLPPQSEVLEKLRLANSYFMAKWPDPGTEIVTNRARPANIWTRAVYYEGLLDLYQIDPDKRYLDYAILWGERHDWGLNRGVETRNADNHCCGQIYLALYEMDRRPERIRDIKASLDKMIADGGDTDWSWIDALQMAMPVFAKLGAITGDTRYLDKMHALYLYSKNKHGERGLFNPADGLWWRDRDFDPPYVEPNGEDCYWSRGNGWVVAAMVRTVDLLPAGHPLRAEYTDMLKTMCEALRKVQREDGFWNVSLHDPTNFGGKETTGTALFVYGMAWGVRQGILPRETYLPVIAKAWKAMASESVQPNGFLAYVQSTGKEPKDGQPVTADKVPDFEDYGLGCFLLAGVEVYRLIGDSTAKGAR
jgi:unsaturated rhamnogalacturonyl hydrolase